MEQLTSKFLASAEKFWGTTTLSHPSFPGMTSEEGRYSRPLPLDQVWEDMLGTLDTTRWRSKHTVACSGQRWLQEARLSETNSTEFRACRDPHPTSASQEHWAGGVCSSSQASPADKGAESLRGWSWLWDVRITQEELRRQDFPREPLSG